MDEQRKQDVLNTWTDELNAALAPLEILLSGVDAASILPSGALASPCEALRGFSNEHFAAIAERANEDFETNQVRPEHIGEAVRRTLWHWDNR